MWFAPLRACAMDRQPLTLEAPNEFSEVWLKDNYLSLMQDAWPLPPAASCRSNSKSPAGAVPMRRSPAPPRRQRPKPRQRPLNGPLNGDTAFQSQEHLRHLRRRQQQQFRLRRRQGRGRSAGQILQPAVSLWRRWVGQDAFAARHRPARFRPTKRAPASPIFHPKNSRTNTLTASRTTSSPNSAKNTARPTCC